ncbi:OstA-like protein [Sphingobacterium psychroaquaticum]|uniref:OstA-like protein n=1 Tax=Sphingobacterium psychroaquaticum TaxID=561061 RepID=UPI001F0D145D|nr:OstA-like protein [Sphingobacterium psychroaquaticum]
MKYYLTLILSVFFLNSLLAQDELRLVSSLYSTIIEQKGISSITPVYQHKGNTLMADSGIIYQDAIGRQFFEAFGNVVIIQTNGTTIHADKLHYDAAPQVATLTNNVRMVSPNSVLTTNHLVYKMRDRIGTYTGGGRIISRGDTITSRNAYYFENTQDAYFRNKVIVRTPDVKIYTDTMRYNSNERMTYFFGPTNIKGNKAENLYTEKGDYNTGTGVARFSKNNLYTEGSRFLKGDSLYYERATGIGKAYRNVVFVDTVDKFIGSGGYGLYNQADGSITLTDKPLVITVVKKDSTEQTKTDSTAVKLSKEDKKNSKDKEKERDKELAKKKNDKDDSEKIATRDKLKAKEPDEPELIAIAPEKKVEMDSVYTTADTLFSKLIFLRDYKALNFNLDRNGGELEIDKDVDYGDDEDELSEGEKASLSDSLTVDSLELPKVIAPLIDNEAQTTKKATAAKKTITPIKKDDTPLDIGATIKQDSLLRQKAVVPTIGQADTLMNKALTIANTPETITIPPVRDSAYLDTAKTRIIKAYHNVRLFKSDLQAVADSAYYGMADSMFRFMGKPMIWAQGSQISGDTIYMQAVNQKLDNALLLGNAFMVNAVLDSVKFNQLKGRKITAFFTNNSIDRLYVDGNAENLVFSTNDKTNTITEMFHDRGARIKIKMEDKKIIDYITIRKVDQKVYPFKLVTQENEVLPGFIWRPQDRPTSKEDMMNRKREINKEGVPSGTEANPADVTAPADKENAVKEGTPKVHSSSTEEIKETVQEEVKKDLLLL